MSKDKGLDMPRCILIHDHNHDEGDCVYEYEDDDRLDEITSAGTRQQAVNINQG